MSSSHLVLPWSLSPQTCSSTGLPSPPPCPCPLIPSQRSPPPHCSGNKDPPPAPYPPATPSPRADHAGVGGSCLSLLPTRPHHAEVLAAQAPLCLLSTAAWSRRGDSAHDEGLNELHQQGPILLCCVSSWVAPGLRTDGHGGPASPFLPVHPPPSPCSCPESP